MRRFFFNWLQISSYFFFHAIAGISCSKPQLPDEAKILHGSTYLYSDKVVILCANGDIVENYCHADGQWSLDLRKACHG